MNRINDYSTYLRMLKCDFSKCNGLVTDSDILQFIAHYRLDKDYGININDIKKDLRSNSLIKNDNTAPRPICITELPKAKIDSFEEYIRQLEAKYVNNGRMDPSDNELETFIKDNKLDITYGILLMDVKKDLKTIENKYKTPVSIPVRNKAPSLVKYNDSVANYEDYIRILNEWYVKYKDQMYLESKAKEFLGKYELDKNFAITTNDIRIDLITIASGKIQNHGRFQKNNNKTQPVPQENINSARHDAYDEDFQKEFAEMLKKHIDAMDDKRRMCGLMRDYFPNRRTEVNILIMLMDYNIIREVQDAEQLNSLFQHKMVKRIIGEFGVGEDLACNMTKIWCLSYGMNILNKECRL